jgi:hypothetical protein
VRFDDEKPKFSFRPQWKHLIYLLDLAIIAALFLAGGWAFRTTVGEKKLLQGQRERELTHQKGVRLRAQADSVLTAEGARLQRGLADSVTWAQNLADRRARMEAAAALQQQINQALTPLVDQVFDFQYRATSALGEVRQYKEDLRARRKEVADLRAEAEEARQQLDEAQRRQQKASAQLARARNIRTQDPAGLFPDRSGLTLRQDISETRDLTNVEFQHSVWSPGRVDVGVSLGLGLGSGEVASAKQFGLVVTRPLIHRRLGLDLGAGYSVLSRSAGSDESGPYASASLRLSPFYRERFHVGLGARAAEEEVTPFVSVGVGRR